MQISKHEMLKQSIYQDYVFESMIKYDDVDRILDSNRTIFQLSSQRKQTKDFKQRTILNIEQVNTSTIKSQVHQKHQNILSNSFTQNYGEQINIKQLENPNSPTKAPKRHYSQRKKSQNEEFGQKDSTGNHSTNFSQIFKSSQPNSLGYSLNSKLILPKIKSINVEKLFTKKFKGICKAIGKFILLFYQVQPNTSPRKQLNKSKQKMVLTLKKIFKFDRQINETLFLSIRNWVQPSFQKIFFHLQNTISKYSENKQYDNNEQKDQEQVWMLNFAKFLFQNLELITRKGNIPKEIIIAMSQAIYKENNQYVQLFIAQRTQFYRQILQQAEIQLICSEYILFNLIVSQMFDLANRLKFQSFDHNLNCKVKILELTSIINLYFIKAFQNMPIINFEFRQEELYSRMVYITPDKNQFIYLLDTKEKNNNDTMILGLKNSAYVQNTLQQRQKQNQKLEILFKQIIHNLHLQVLIY